MQSDKQLLNNSIDEGYFKLPLKTWAENSRLLAYIKKKRIFEVFVL